MSVSFYVLAGFFRTQIKSIEAAMKYFLLGAFATAFLLYGIAMIYGATATIDLSEITTKVQNGNINHLSYLIIGIGLVIIGLSFKVAAFPFHQWAPDVYHGAPTVVTGYMSTAGKSAALVAFIIIAKALIPSVMHHSSDFANYGQLQSILSNSDTIRFIIAVISAATMLVGNFTALIQKNVKRMLAYSSVAHAGYMLMGIVANNADGWTGILYYSAAYLFMQLGAFLILSIFERNYDNNIYFENYSGLSKYQPLLSASMAIFMFSLAGLPPFAGFFGKYFLFKAAIETGYLWLSIVAIISSIISMYYYIGLVLHMYFKEKEHEEMKVEKAGLAKLSISFSVAMVFLLAIFSWFIVNLSDKFFK
jgi:NADH-quinone oxidoreductase subunit N